MKRTDYKTYLSQAFVTLVFMGAMSACVEEEIFSDNFKKTSVEGLSVITSVSEPTVVTRATTESDEALNEKHLQTLDVFVEPVEPVADAGTLISQYHLVTTNDKPILEQANNWLADNWRAEGLEIGKYYNIYVATNNTQTSVTRDLSTFNVAALKALVADEVTDGIAVVDETTNNISWPNDWQLPSGNIYKQYVTDNSNNVRAWTTEKEFMMDGILENWTPDATTRDQVFGTETEPVILNRAAAKIVLNVKFDADFLKSLTQIKTITNGVETWVDKPAEEQVTITGTPAWRFYNFAFGAPVFAPETQGAGVEVHNSTTMLYHPYAYAGDDKHFSITTYTYPNKWAEADYATAAPSLVISVGYTENGVTNYNYYRIPLVKSTVTEIERNHIYVINATIATRGSEMHEDTHEIEDVQYAVLPWNDDTNSDATHSEVQSVQHYYFNANPKVYTLRGDGDQSVTINYSKAVGTKVNWKLFTYDANGNQTGVVANNANGAVRAWFYDANGNFITKYDDNSGTDWSKMGVNIVQSTEGTSGSNGTITVTSTALNNKAIKYIRFRVYLDEVNDDNQSLEETYHEDILIRHFPTDNIQSIPGNWASYHDANQSSSTTIYKTRSLAEAQSLAAQYGVTFTSEEIETTDIINYATWYANRNIAGYNRENPETRTRQQFANALTTNPNRRDANGEANGILSDGYYYWGVNPSRVNSNNQSDYYTADSYYGYEYNYVYYQYQTRYRTRYTHTYTYTEYTLELPVVSTGDWVDWDAADKNNHNDLRTYTITYGNGEGTFDAKVMDGATMYAIEENSHGYGNNRYYSTDLGDSESLTNNNMYVIQISSTSDTYVLGRPYVNQTSHQSQDNVVSPAFMIASQLGAVLPFTGNNGPVNAATHCSRYMEVSNGIRYTGWRLPTEAEIKVITGYQYGNIGGVTIPSQYQAITPVLTGRWYHSLSGQEVEANANAGTNSQTKSYLRCVRDLSAEEVARLNGFDKIQEKYR